MRENEAIEKLNNRFSDLHNGFGEYLSVDGTEHLDPEYDEEGKPRHPYLGRIYVILINAFEIEELDPCFVIYEYTNNSNSRFDYMKVCDREVAFPGAVPARYVVFSKVFCVPSFEGKYKSYYKQKYGINEDHFQKIREQFKADRIGTVESIIKNMIKYTKQTLNEHIDQECISNGIQKVYKGLNGEFVNELPSIKSVRIKRKRLIEQN